MESKYAEQANQLRARCGELLKSVDGGDMDFATLAREQSDCPLSKAKDGLMADVTRETSPMAFAQHAFETEAGKFSPVFTSPLGAHFLQVESRGRNDEGDTTVTVRTILLAYEIEGVGVREPDGARQGALQGLRDRSLRSHVRPAPPADAKVTKKFGMGPGSRKAPPRPPRPKVATTTTTASASPPSAADLRRPPKRTTTGRIPRGIRPPSYPPAPRSPGPSRTDIRPCRRHPLRTSHVRAPATGTPHPSMPTNSTFSFHPSKNGTEAKGSNPFTVPTRCFFALCST